MNLSVRVLLLTIACNAADGFRFHLPAQTCEKISIPLCRRVLPYNLTRFPNSLGDRSQVRANRSIQQYGPLVRKANCSKDAVFFLCTFYLPICIQGVGREESHIIKPCRSLCEQVRNDCAGVMNYWPSFAKCEQLPEYSSGVCIQPESFETVERPPRIIDTDYDPCENKVPVDHKIYRSREYDYVVKFKVTRLIRMRNNKGTIIHGKVEHIFKQNNVTINNDPEVVQTIWSNTNSTCPPLTRGGRFLIGGYENASRQQLLLSSTSLIETWIKNETKKKIKNWQAGRESKETKNTGRKL